ncbi:hypothetical protein CDD83_678 [Cordyceps sp. RAO-2017]|nr:hypothetical protein CDD83_678 [Cordyceps sp. RAO-2017]
MTPARGPGPGPGSPLIAGAGMSTGELRDFDDDLSRVYNPFNFSDSPDGLQSLDVIGSSHQKTFLNPQDLTADPLPDSPNESYQDSSSESASSSKRAGSSDSLKPTPAAAADLALDDCLDVKMEWPQAEYSAFDDDEQAFAFGAAVTPAALMDGFGFGDHDDAFMDPAFDMAGTSNSPEGPLPGPVSMPSPEMPIIKTNSPRRPNQAQQQRAGASHRKQISQYSMAGSPSGVKSTGSREVSPMSALVTSHHSSPAAHFLHSPQPSGGHHFSRAVHDGPTWLNGVDVASPPVPQPDAVPAAVPLAGHMMQAPPVPQPLPLFNAAPPDAPGGYELRIMPTSLKSRVETQIHIQMTLAPLPPGVTKLHLPAHTISKPKFLVKPPPERSPDTLELSVSLVCTSAMQQPGIRQKALDRAARVPQSYLPAEHDDEDSPQNGGEVRICANCISRERKRAARKKVRRPEEDKMWSLDEGRRVIVFNTQEVKEWQPLSRALDPSGRPETTASGHVMQITAPMRIACYCRHHSEKMGFSVIFTLKDFRNRLIAQATSNSIMITDDHKTHPIAQAASQAAAAPEAAATSAAPAPDANGLVPSAHDEAAFLMSTPKGDLGDAAQRHGRRASQPSPMLSVKSTPVAMPNRTLSRPASPSQGGPAAKKRKSSGSAPRVPNGLAMTRLETPPAPSPQNAGPQQSAAASPFSPSQAPFPSLEPLFAHQPPFGNNGGTGPPTPGGTDQGSLYVGARSASVDSLALAHMYPAASASNRPSRAPSPNGPRLDGPSPIPHLPFAPMLAANLDGFAMPAAANPAAVGANPAHSMTYIYKVIPNEGSKSGGTEVTVLGHAFFPGLEVWFGENRATATTYWGDASLLCVLPPSHVAGNVPVTLRSALPAASQEAREISKERIMFRYIDDTEDKLIRVALAVLGHKMSGQIIDASDVARRILNNNEGGNQNWTGGSSSAGQQTGAGSAFHQASHGQHLESQLLKCLDLIDLDRSAHSSRLDLESPTSGHTMLHLACSLGYHRLVAALLARGANPDARDRGGFTPLHMAAMHDNSEIVRRLMLKGADPTMRSLSGLTAADMSQSRRVLRAIRQSRRLTGSLSGSSLHSRASSAASLRSLWEPLTRARTHEEPISADSSEESPEYTSGDFEDEDPDEDGGSLMMRRLSRGRHEAVEADDEGGGRPEAEPHGGPASPTTQFAAFKDQLQQQLHQFQQSMALHLQSLPQMPQMPALPGMPMLPDYQAYLQQAPFVRRMQQLMPGSGARPGPPEGEDGGGKMDNRWWDFTSYMQNSAVAPPSYEDIFGQRAAAASESKQESAMRAATEAEADMKCAAIYDQAAAAAAAAAAGGAGRAGAREKPPNVLKIGRKHAITKEQQEQFLLAHERKFKELSSDRNLFFIWIPLLVAMVCAMLYSYFPSLFPFLWTSVRALAQAGLSRAWRAVQDGPRQAV